MKKAIFATLALLALFPISVNALMIGEGTHRIKGYTSLFGGGNKYTYPDGSERDVTQSETELGYSYYLFDNFGIGFDLYSSKVRVETPAAWDEGRNSSFGLTATYDIEIGERLNFFVSGEFGSLSYEESDSLGIMNSASGSYSSIGLGLRAFLADFVSVDIGAYGTSSTIEDDRTLLETEVDGSVISVSLSVFL